MKELSSVGIIGASCVGKSTQVPLIMKHFSGLFRFSVSATTRPIRPEKEEDGIHYHFYSLEQFMAMKEAGLFLETNQFVNGHWYGTPVSEIARAREEGKILLLDMEYLGAREVYRRYPEESMFIFLDVSDTEAVQRMEKSVTGSRESVTERLKNIAEQRRLVSEENFFSHVIDTTGMEIDFVFNKIANVIHEEIKFRESAKIGPVVA